MEIHPPKLVTKYLMNLESEFTLFPRERFIIIVGISLNNP